MLLAATLFKQHTSVSQFKPLEGQSSWADPSLPQAKHQRLAAAQKMPHVVCDGDDGIVTGIVSRVVPTPKHHGHGFCLLSSDSQPMSLLQGIRPAGAAVAGGKAAAGELEVGIPGSRQAEEPPLGARFLSRDGRGLFLPARIAETRGLSTERAAWDSHLRLGTSQLEPAGAHSALLPCP